MSNRSDIQRAAKTDYRRGLAYTCNCGWLDLGHMDPTSSREHIGAANLWAQLKQDGEYMHVPCAPGHHRPSPTLSRGRLNRSFQEKTYYRFPDKKRGYLVTYRQDNKAGPLRPGVESTYLVKEKLTLIERKRVALAIFKQVSLRFERFQSVAGLWGLITDSGFSQEDLVSNLLGFLIAIGETTRKEVLEKCHVVSVDSAHAIWDRDGPVGENKNKTFKPSLSVNTGREDDDAKVCIDECVGQPLEFPFEKAFKTLDGERPGKLFVEWK